MCICGGSALARCLLLSSKIHNSTPPIQRTTSGEHDSEARATRGTAVQYVGTSSDDQSLRVEKTETHGRFGSPTAKTCGGSRGSGG